MTGGENSDSALEHSKRNAERTRLIAMIKDGNLRAEAQKRFDDVQKVENILNPLLQAESSGLNRRPGRSNSSDEAPGCP